jgi:hypothetical protein
MSAARCASAGKTSPGLTAPSVKSAASTSLPYLMASFSARATCSFVASRCATRKGPIASEAWVDSADSGLPRRRYSVVVRSSRSKKNSPVAPARAPWT